MGTVPRGRTEQGTAGPGVVCWRSAASPCLKISRQWNSTVFQLGQRCSSSTRLAPGCRPTAHTWLCVKLPGDHTMDEEERPIACRNAAHGQFPTGKAQHKLSLSQADCYAWCITSQSIGTCLAMPHGRKAVQGHDGREDMQGPLRLHALFRILCRVHVVQNPRRDALQAATQTSLECTAHARMFSP